MKSPKLYSQMLVFLCALALSSTARAGSIQEEFIHAVSKNDRVKVKQFLADPKTRSQLDLNSALFKAVDTRGAETILEMLIHAGADLESRQSITTYTPLMTAIRGQKEEMVLKLLDLGADIRAKDSTGKSGHDQMYDPTCHGDIIKWKPETVAREKAAYDAPTLFKKDNKHKLFPCPEIQYEKPSWRFKIESQALAAPSFPIEAKKTEDGVWELYCEGTLTELTFSGHIEEKTGQVTHWNDMEGLGYTEWGFANYRCPKLKVVSAKTSRFVSNSAAFPTTEISRISDAKGGGRLSCRARSQKARIFQKFEGDALPHSCIKSDTGFVCTLYP